MSKRNELDIPTNCTRAAAIAGCHESNVRADSRSEDRRDPNWSQQQWSCWYIKQTVGFLRRRSRNSITLFRHSAIAKYKCVWTSWELFCVKQLVARILSVAAYSKRSVGITQGSPNKAASRLIRKFHEATCQLRSTRKTERPTIESKRSSCGKGQ